MNCEPDFQLGLNFAMIDSDMMQKRPPFAKTFMIALCLSASVISPAGAAEVTFLPDIPADQIANDTVRSYDSRSGVSIVTAPTFDPFEQDNTVAGTAALRTGPSETTIDGRRVSGGAYLDLKMIYTSPSDDPYDLRGFERSFFVSGEPVNRIRQETRTLDCAANTADVTYQEDYYSGFDNYGYLAGLYLLLPQYRGHRGFWSGGSRYRPSAGWSDWRRRGGIGKFGGYHGGYYAGHGFRRGDDGRGSGRRGDGGNTDTPVGRSTDNNRSERHNGRDRVMGGSAANREYRRQRGVVTGGPLQTSRGNNRAELSNERAATERAERRNASRNQDRSARRATRRSSPIARTTSQPIARTGRPAIRETISNRRVNPAGATPSPIARQSSPRSGSRPVSRPFSQPKSRAVSRPAPIQRPVQRPVQRSEPRTERKSNTKPFKSRSSSRRLNREVDRSFRKNTRAQRGKRMEFFPQLGVPMLGGYSRPHTVVTNYRCVREETVTLHIPQERLDAARFDGMTLVVVDNADRDVPVYLPPNYIEGFRRATGRVTSYQSSPYTVPSTTVVTPQPRYQGGYPQN